jgi:hypothetical protein
MIYIMLKYICIYVVHTVLTLCLPVFNSIRHADRDNFHSYSHFLAEINSIWLAESVTRIAINNSRLGAVKHTDSSKIIRKPRTRADKSSKRLRRHLVDVTT